MTVIAAIFDEAAGRFVLGSNSRSLIGRTVMAADRSKWFRDGDWAYGLTGGGIAGDAIAARRAKFPGDAEDIFAVTAFFRRCLGKLELGETEDGARDYDLSALVAHRSGRLWDVDGTLSVEEINRGAVWANGSGYRFALGAAQVLSAQGASPRAVVEGAIAAAIALDSSCPGEPIIEGF